MKFCIKCGKIKKGRSGNLCPFCLYVEYKNNLANKTMPTATLPEEKLPDIPEEELDDDEDEDDTPPKE